MTTRNYESASPENGFKITIDYVCDRPGCSSKWRVVHNTETKTLEEPATTRHYGGIYAEEENGLTEKEGYRHDKAFVGNDEYYERVPCDVCPNCLQDFKDWWWRNIIKK